MARPLSVANRCVALHRHRRRSRRRRRRRMEGGGRLCCATYRSALLRVSTRLRGSNPVQKACTCPGLDRQDAPQHRAGPWISGPRADSDPAIPARRLTSSPETAGSWCGAERAERSERAALRLPPSPLLRPPPPPAPVLLLLLLFSIYSSY